MDYHLGKLFQELETLQLLNNSLIIITSDHGESFGEHEKWGHGELPVENQVHVPLIIHYPSVIKKPKTIAGQVQTASICSTILSSLGIPVPSCAMRGEGDINLLKAWDGKDIRLPEYTFAELFLPKRYMSMIRSNKYKYLMKKAFGNKEGKTVEWLFDLANDPKELNNLIGMDIKRDDLFREEHSKFIKELSHTKIELNASSPNAAKKLDQRTREQLKALGYVR